MSKQESQTGREGVDSIVQSICQGHDNAPAALIEILHDVHEEIGFAGESTQAKIAACLNITKAEVHGVMSFYDDFRATQSAPCQVRICRGEACQAMGAERLFEGAKRHGQDLPGIEVAAVFCLGNCALAPAGMINNKLHGRLDGARLKTLIARTTKTKVVAK